jgi:hypothetical protein
MGEILVNEGIVSWEQLEEALAVQRSTGELLGLVLMNMGIAAESDISKVLCLQYQLPFISLANYEIDDKLVTLFPKEFLHRHRLLPFDRIGETLLIIVAQIPSQSALAEIPKLTKLNAALYVGYLSDVTKLLKTLVPLDDKEQAQVTGEIIADVKEALGPGVSPGSPQQEPVESDDAEPNTLVFGSQDSFLNDLNSTWDSIFNEAKGESDPAGQPAKKKKNPKKG